MALTPSAMLALGTTLPMFSLPDTLSGGLISSDNFAGKKVLIGFICNHCPFVVHILPQLVAACNEFKSQGVEVVMISANNPETHPQDSPDKMSVLAQSSGFEFPYCFDESQDVARSFEAACTPEFYLFDEQHSLIYRGQFDNSRPGNDSPVTGADLKAAVALAADGKVAELQKPSVGCGIKWK